MKKPASFLLLSIVGLFCLSSSNGPKYPKIDNDAFQIGEKLRYRISYGFVDAGEATLEVKYTEKKGANRELYHVVGIGKTLGAFNSVFKVEDTYESYIDQKSIMPWYFVRRVDEGGYKIKQDYTFRHYAEKVENSKGKKFDAPMGVQDMISCFYFARTLDFKDLKKGKVFTIPCFMDDELFNLKIRLGICALLGHVFPIYVGFKGGKGVATLLGIILAINHEAALMSIGVFLITLVISGYVSLSSIIAGVFFPVVVMVISKTSQPDMVVFALMITIAVVITHQKNIERLLSKKESRVKILKRKSREEDNISASKGNMQAK